MKSFNLNSLIAVGGFFLTVTTIICSLVIQYVNAEKRKYGLERDFAHIKRNYEQIVQNLNVIIAEIDHRSDAIDRTLIEIKSLLLK